MVFHPERLVAARTLTGVTQIELAAASGIGQSMISMVESNQREFSPELAASFSETLALPIEFFSVMPRSIPRDSLNFRKQASARVTDTRRVHQLFSEGFRVTETLLDTSGYPRPMLPVVQDSDEILPIDRLEEIAAETRSALSLHPTSPVSNVTRALERSGVVVAPLSVDGSTLEGHAGVSWTAGVGDAALIGIMHTRGDRDRFTLAHELGHLVLHSFRRSADPEREANQFAGAFLIPEAQVREMIDPDATLIHLRRAKASWGMSIQALLYRASAIGQIREERSRTLWKQISARGWRKNEPGEVGIETPKLLYKLMQVRFGPTPFTSKQISAELALPVLTLRSLAPTPSINRGATPNDVVTLQSRRAMHG